MTSEELQHFAFVLAWIAVACGFAGGCLYTALYGLIETICDRLHERSLRLDRIAKARERAAQLVKAMPRG